jgi:hypothetical protein
LVERKMDQDNYTKIEGETN